MSSNKQKREELERMYGKGSMFEKSKAEQYIETLPRIKGVKQYIKEKHYTGKQIKQLDKQMQYHHLVHRAEGGKTTLENGAVVSALEHPYLHSLPRQYEEIINNHIRKWKIDFMTFTTDKVLDHNEISADCRDTAEEYIEIPVKEYRTLSKKQLRRMKRRQEKRELKEKMKELEK